MAYVPPLRQLMPLLFSLLPLLLMTPEPSLSQLFGLGPCPHYQSETLFTDQRIDKLKGSGRYSVLLSHNPDLECMSFNFIDDVRLSFDFKDMRRHDPVLQSERGRYIASPNLFRKRGYLKVDMERDGVLGCNPFGPVKLIPLLFTDTYEVWAACTGLLAVHFEHLFVLVTEPISLRTDDVTPKITASSTNSLLSNDVTSLPSTSTNSSSFPSPSHNYIAIDLGSAPTVASPEGQPKAEASIDLGSAPTMASPEGQPKAKASIDLGSAHTVASPEGQPKAEASIGDNFFNRTQEAAGSVVKRIVARAEGGLRRRVARQTLAADIRDDLIDRGFPHANALRLKYETCDD